MVNSDPGLMAESLKTLAPCPFSKRYRVPVDQAWQWLSAYFVYRLLIALLFFILYSLKIGPSLLGSHNNLLFAVTSALYLGAILLGGLMLYLRRPIYTMQILIQSILDTLALTLMMHASGGIESGIGILIALSVAAGGLLAGSQCTLVLAAFSTLAILGEQVYSDLTNAFTTTTYTYAGMLGTAFFGIALLTHVLSKRLEKSEAIATQRGIDIVNLEQLNEHIIQHMQSGIIIADLDENIRMMNESAQRFFDRRSESNSLKILSNELCQQLREWRSSSSDYTATIDFESEHEVQVRFLKLGETLGSFTMITLEASASINQRIQQSKLASLGRLTASIAHEIRNPIGAISHASQLLTECSTLSEEDSRLTQIIREHTDRVDGIIENILQLSRRTASKQQLIPLESWLSNFMLEFQLEQQLDQAPLQLQISEKNPKIRIDPSHLKQILDNLCSNALRHCPKTNSQILLRVDRHDKRICIDVVDNGASICEKNILHIFEPFFTTSNSGTGLGLYIARELSELNQAKLEYVVPATGGNCFRLCLFEIDNSLIQL